MTGLRKNEFTYKKSGRKKIDDTVIYICIDEWLDWQIVLFLNSEVTLRGII